MPDSAPHHFEEEEIKLYIDAALPCFAKTQESATRLAGILVQAELAGGRAVLDAEPRSLGFLACKEANELFRAAVIPHKHQHFHHHLSQALESLTQAWKAYEGRRNCLIGAGDPLPPLRQTWADLRTASRILPGFETVDYQFSCCAMHGNNDKTINNGGNNVGVFHLDS